MTEIGHNFETICLFFVQKGQFYIFASTLGKAMTLVLVFEERVVVLSQNEFNTTVYHLMLCEIHRRLFNTDRG